MKGWSEVAGGSFGGVERMTREHCMDDVCFYKSKRALGGIDLDDLYNDHLRTNRIE